MKAPQQWVPAVRFQQGGGAERYQKGTWFARRILYRFYFMQKTGIHHRPLLARELLADAEIVDLDFLAQISVVAIATRTSELAPVNRAIPRRAFAQWSTVGFIGGV